MWRMAHHYTHHCHRRPPHSGGWWIGFLIFFVALSIFYMTAHY